MSLFDHDDYRSYLREHIANLPNKGRGELSRLAQHLEVNTTWISQIMSGSQNFNQEQGYRLSLYLGHMELETDYFSLLIQIERAGTSELKEYLRKKLSAIKAESLKLSKRVVYEKKLSDQDRAIFYSSWIYSAIHIYTSLFAKGVTSDEIAERFGLSKLKVAEAVRFLLSVGIITEKSGRYLLGVQSTFIEQGSPYILKHHSSWRVKAIQKSESLSGTEMMVTGQYSISKKDFLILREKLTEFVKTLNTTIQETDPEEIACLNIDWFWLDK
ncbi:MAG TPA: TIGR02147 family protein [Bdellovibrio sp.]|jgi:uncharacterized protein (TIGR02147 family)|nr:TIGR02147 family protein [Bdellovibrio sp.]